MVFDYNKEKSRSNLEKHGIDFTEAQKLWDGPYAEFAAKSEFENRFALIGPIKGKLYTCIFTLRDEVIRIISCRRSHKKEARLYEKSVNKAKNR